MATRRRATARKTAPRPSRARSPRGALNARLTPEVVRSIIGLTLLVLGAMTLIALMLPGQGALTSWWTDVFAPVVRDDALAPAVLPAGRRLVAGMGSRHQARIGLGDHAARPHHHVCRGGRRRPGPGRVGRARRASPGQHPDRPLPAGRRVRPARRPRHLRLHRRVRDPAPPAPPSGHRHRALGGLDRRRLHAPDTTRGRRDARQGRRRACHQRARRPCQRQGRPDRAIARPDRRLGATTRAGSRRPSRTGAKHRTRSRPLAARRRRPRSSRSSPCATRTTSPTRAIRR